MFDFGKNWRRYSSKVLGPERIQTAKASVAQLLDMEDLQGKTFLDIGCGSGIFAIGAALLGARSVTGIDVDPESVRASMDNIEKYAPGREAPKIMEASILDPAKTGDLGTYDVVYAWGSLHHTGRMWDALRASAGLAAPGGILAVAIYNRHFTSPAWLFIKWFFNISPLFIRKIMYYIFIPVILLAKFAATGKNPLKKRRGMDFYVDVLDWIGGYPYECAAPEEVTRFVEDLGFDTVKTAKGPTPIACNEFVFRKHNGL